MPVINIEPNRARIEAEDFYIPMCNLKEECITFFSTKGRNCIFCMRNGRNYSRAKGLLRTTDYYEKWVQPGAQE